METPEQKEERLCSWLHAVKDKFKPLTKEEIQEELNKTSHPFSVLFENIKGDFNMASGIRNANSFNARSIYYFGNKRFDKRGAVGCQNYKAPNLIRTREELLELKERYTFIGFDNIPGSVPIEPYDWKTEKEPLMIFGEEGSGISRETLDMCDVLLEISSWGSVRSINVAAAAGIAMYDFVKKYHDNRS